MKLPDGPQAPPFIQLFRAIANPLENLEAAAQRYGDIFTSRLSGFAPFVVISNPQGIQQIMTADPNLFESGRGNRILMPLVGDQSMLLLDGDRHQRQRRLLMPPFHGERMRAYGQLIREISQEVIAQQPIGKVFSARSMMQEISLRVILRAVFGLDQGERYQQLRQHLSLILDAVGSRLGASFLFIPALQRDLGPWSLWGRFLRQKQQIDQLLYAEIRDRRTALDPSGEDILSLMLSARDETGQPMTDAELRDELITLLFAGHETTASALGWALYWIHQRPDVRERLLQELDSLGHAPDPSEIARLPYLSAVAQETLRIYPIALFTFSRIVKVPIEIMGYRFEPGTQLAPCVYLTHHRQDVYPEPKQFRPERFLERQFSPYEYLPFGGGNRRCIGMAFAQFEIKLVLATVLSHLQLALAEKSPVRPVRRGITLAPAGGVKMMVICQRPQVSIPVQL
jgi:cytochrome P450